jgi:hypothetical protein
MACLHELRGGSHLCEENKRNATRSNTMNTRIDHIDNIENILTKLHALTQHTFGGSFESFNNLNDEIRDAYLWTMADLVTTARAELRQHLKERHPVPDLKSA